MAAAPYQNLGVDIGLVQGPAASASREAAALADRGQTIAQLGQTTVGAASQFAQQFEHAKSVARLNDAQTKALVDFNDLEQQFKHDTDFQTAPDRFKEEATKIIGKRMAEANLSPDDAAHLQHSLMRLSLSAGKTIENHAWSGQQSQIVANINQSSIALQTRFAAAGSDAERGAILLEQQDQVAAAVGAGWINAEQGQRAVAGFRRNVQDGELVALINRDPRAAIAALEDPKRFDYLDPTLRATRIEQAKNVVDTHGMLEVGNLSLRAPERAALVVGKASDPGTVAAIYDKGVIPQESGGRADAVSPKGALGIGQLMPGTARAAAERVGLKDVAALPDDALKSRLLSDAPLNRRLGLDEFRRLVDRYDGDVPAALAGYNAGPGNANTPRADAWRAQAIEKFGPNYTPEQFASVIPIKETRDYVLSVYARLGARTDAMGLSDNARLRAQSSVAQAVHEENAQFKALLSRMAADAVTNDPLADALKGGAYVDPGRISAQRQLLTQAASAGDANAAKELRQLDYAEEAAPIMERAYRMAPADLSAVVASEQARAANSEMTPGELRRLDTLKTVFADVSARAQSDPIGLASRAGAFRVQPLPVDAPTSPQFGAALAARDGQAAAAAELYNTALTPLRPQEAAALKDFWASSGPSERVGLAAQFAAHLRPDAASAAMRQVAGDDSLSQTAGRIALKAPETAQKIMLGASLLESAAVKPKVSDVRAALGDVVKGALYASPKMQNDAIEAGLAVYAANRAGSGALFDASDREGVASAIEEVTGKVVTINGARTPIPPGFAPAGVTRGLASLSADDLAPFGGLQPGLAASDVAAHGQLHALEIGGTHYAVTLAGRAVMDASGTRPLIVDLTQVAAVQQARGIKHYASPNAARADIMLRNPVAFRAASGGL